MWCHVLDQDASRTDRTIISGGSIKTKLLLLHTTAASCAAHPTQRDSPGLRRARVPPLSARRCTLKLTTKPFAIGWTLQLPRTALVPQDTRSQRGSASVCLPVVLSRLLLLFAGNGQHESPHFSSCRLGATPPNTTTTTYASPTSTMMTIARSSLALLLVVSAISTDISTASSNLRARKLQTYASYDDYCQLMLDAVNSERAKAGLSALCTNKKLAAAAKRHSDDMATNNYMAHDGADGSTMSQRVTDAGYEWNAVAENVAAGQEDVTSVMESWMNSEGHRANILGSDYTMFGTAYAYDGSTTYKHYWTQDFGAGDTEECDSGSSTASQSTDQTQQQQTQQDDVAGEASTSQDYTSAPSTTAPTTTAPPATTAPTATETPATEAPVGTSAPATESPVTESPSTETPGCKAKK
ncbi:hypothetical protein PHYPSEUDO_000852 [Phytophthora pseudosyringae]|uniref:SCP domain-containing protein n=1 Tax=Phytophthora pseudosyringae TaxID=221518 RepID=A0A8T1VXC8_9STRA|nr:hypothetical protein PHYPSEUDO_000852 [Phytophthora pseudosyringae]